jgi:hypothetical protein
LWFRLERISRSLVMCGSCSTSQRGNARSRFGQRWPVASERRHSQRCVFGLRGVTSPSHSTARAAQALRSVPSPVPQLRVRRPCSGTSKEPVERPVAHWPGRKPAVREDHR